MTERTCTVDGCGKAHRAKGYCASHYNSILKPDRHRTEKVCAECGTAYVTKRTQGRYCSMSCAHAEERRSAAARLDARPAYDPWAHSRSMRSPLRVAMEDGSPSDILSAIRALSDETASGCWEWQRRLSRDGYPQVRIGDSTLQVHRLSLAASLGVSLGKQPVHHRCANTRCVNPAHLQPVSHRENAAEMLARTWMEERIRTLEEALASVDPRHPALDEVSLATL